MILFYDGLCGFCNRTVQFVLKRDHSDRFKFAPIQSDFGQKTLAEHQINSPDLNTVYLLLDEDTDNAPILTKGKAALETLRFLGGGWPLLALLRFLPRFIIDFGYDLIAKNRYRISSKLESCPLPSAQDRAKFIGL